MLTGDSLLAYPGPPLFKPLAVPPVAHLGQLSLGLLHQKACHHGYHELVLPDHPRLAL